MVERRGFLSALTAFAIGMVTGRVAQAKNAPRAVCFKWWGDRWKPISEGDIRRHDRILRVDDRIDLMIVKGALSHEACHLYIDEVGRVTNTE